MGRGSRCTGATDRSLPSLGKAFSSFMASSSSSSPSSYSSLFLTSSRFYSLRLAVYLALGVINRSFYRGTVEKFHIRSNFSYLFLVKPRIPQIFTVASGNEVLEFAASRQIVFW